MAMQHVPLDKGVVFVDWTYTCMHPWPRGVADTLLDFNMYVHLLYAHVCDFRVSDMQIFDFGTSDLWSLRFVSSDV